MIKSVHVPDLHSSGGWPTRQMRGSFYKTVYGLLSRPGFNYEHQITRYLLVLFIKLFVFTVKQIFDPSKL